MPSVGFKLFADSTEFERGLASAEGSTKKLRDVIGNLGGFIKGTFAVTAIYGMVNGVKSAIAESQRLRDEAAKLGQTVDLNTEAVARFGDAFGDSKKGIIGAATNGLIQFIGFFNRAGEAYGKLFTLIRGGEDALERIDSNDAKARHIAVLEGGMEAAKKLGEFRKQTAYEEATANEKVNLLLADNIQLQKAQQSLEFGSAAYKEKQLAIEQNNKKLHELDLGFQKEDNALVDQKLKLIEKEEEQRRAELPILDQIKETQEEISDLLADQKLLGVDTKEYLDLAARIDKARESLHGLNEERKKLTADKQAVQERIDKIGAEKTESIDERSKLTLQELANLTPFSPGISTAATSQNGSARQIMGLEAQGNQARLSGFSDQANDYFSQAHKMRQGLDALKPSERQLDKEDSGAAAVAELKAINDKLKGKFANE